MEPTQVEGEETTIDICTLPNWSALYLEATQNGAMSSEKIFDSSPFPISHELNKKISLWCGDISAVNAHVIVHPTNETLSDANEISIRIFNRAGPGLQKELLSIKSCRTGDCVLTDGFGLPSRYVIHTVGPRWNTKYESAAETALHSCYRKALEIVRERRFPSVAFPLVHSCKKGFPVDRGAHIAIRTVRRFLERYGDSIEMCILVMESCEEHRIYEVILPLYFPRSQKEELQASYLLPKDIGDAMGEPFIQDRCIRIQDNPQHFNVEGESEAEDREELSVRTFAQMTDDPDTERLLGGRQASRIPIPVDPLARKVTLQEQYERLLRKGKKEDLTEISNTGCLYQSGMDRCGRPVVIFIGKWFDVRCINLDKALLYLVCLLDGIVSGDYVVLYFHTLTGKHNRPALHWIRTVYNILPYKYKKNLKGFHIVHPSFWTKVMTWWFLTWMAPGIKGKVHNVSGVEYLYSIMDPDQLDIPAFITEYDMTVNGFRYYQPC